MAERAGSTELMLKGLLANAEKGGLAANVSVICGTHDHARQCALRFAELLGATAIEMAHQAATHVRAGDSLVRFVAMVDQRHRGDEAQLVDHWVLERLQESERRATQRAIAAEELLSRIRAVLQVGQPGVG